MDTHKAAAFCAIVLGLMFIYGIGIANASYTVTNLNTTVTLNTNTSASVTELLTVAVSNTSLNSYETDRIALNLTLSTWQSLIGPYLVQHIINPKSGVYNFKFLPGPLIKSYNSGTAYLLMSYSVKNVTDVKQISPRVFEYSFNDSVFNFEHVASGEALPQNTTLNILLPNGALLTSIYPLPDAPTKGISSGYPNVTKFSWFEGEPLSKFTLAFKITETLQQEVTDFFTGVYSALGIFSYMLIGVVILAFIVYAYLRASR